MTRPLVVRDGRHPFEVACLLFGVLFGAAGVVGSDLRSQSIELAWGAAASVVWYLLLTVSATFCMWAVFAPWLRPETWLPVRVRRARLMTRIVSNRWVRDFSRALSRQVSLTRALQLERIGMYGFGYTLLSFVPAAFASAGGAGATAAGAFGLLALATGARIRQIHVDLRKLDSIDRGLRRFDRTAVVADPDDSRGAAG